MPRILFIRPAETDHCLRNTILGRHDADLNNTGLQQADALAEALMRFSISYIGVSPLKRAMSTAMAIETYQPGTLIHPVPGFHGVDMGDWENRDMDIVQGSDRARYESFRMDPDFPAPGGESIREVYARAYPDLVHIVHQTGKDETIALILQETVMRALCCGVLDLPLEAAPRFTMHHGAYSIFERIFPGGPYQLVNWNRNHHLNRETKVPYLEEELPPVG